MDYSTALVPSNNFDSDRNILDKIRNISTNLEVNEQDGKIKNQQFLDSSNYGFFISKDRNILSSGSRKIKSTHLYSENKKKRFCVDLGNKFVILVLASKYSPSLLCSISIDNEDKTN